jgi:HPt (histidine-containing phosphotransfer) domain-containing protein
MDEREIRTKLAAVWKKYLPEMSERVAVLERACESLTARKLTEAERESALAAAHKLAGALGTFGRAHGTELARDLESVLQSGNLTRDQISNLNAKIVELRSILRQD